jgi:hypothetical protein
LNSRVVVNIDSHRSQLGNNGALAKQASNQRSTNCGHDDNQ